MGAEKKRNRCKPKRNQLEKVLSKTQETSSLSDSEIGMITGNKKLTKNLRAEWYNDHVKAQAHLWGQGLQLTNRSNKKWWIMEKTAFIINYKMC